MAQSSGHKYLEIGVLEVKGLEAATPDARCQVQVVVDGVRSRTKPGEASRSAVFQWRAADDAGLLQWTLRESDLTRLQVHEPRVRVEVLLDGTVVGSSQYDLRDLNFRRDSCERVRKDLALVSAYAQVEVVFEAGIRTPTTSEASALASSRLSIGSMAGGEADADALGMALGEEHVLIGAEGDLNMTLYITLMGLSGTQPLLRATQSTLDGVTRFWIEYHIFGVQVETEAFPSLKYARFAPIRDSFQIRSSRRDVARFLQQTPIRVYLCCAGEDVKRQRSRRLVLASTLLRFDSLFSSGTEFVQATSNCAFSLQAHEPYEMQLRTGETLPSMAVSLELHVDGKVSQVVLQDAASTPALANQDEAVQTETAANYSALSIGEHLQLEVLSFDLDPLEDDGKHADEQYEAEVRLILRVQGTAQRAVGTTRFRTDDYGQLEQATVNNLHLHMTRDQLPAAVLECQHVKSGTILAAGTLEASDSDVASGKEFTTVQLVSHANTTRGSAQVRLRPLLPREGPGPIPVPASPQAPISQDETVYHYRITIDLRSIKGLEQAHNVYLQYTYPLFGMTHTIQTRPPILVDRYSERIVPHGLNLFQFKVSRAALERSARSEPLVVEMWNRDQYAADERLGFCALPLRKLLEARPYFQWSGQTFATLRDLERYRERFLGAHAKTDNKGLATAQRNAERMRKQLDVPPLQVQVLETDLMICAFEQHEDAASASGVKRIASVRCTCTLENLGPIHESPRKTSSHGRTRARSLQRQTDDDTCDGSLADAESVGKASASKLSALDVQSEGQREEVEQTPLPEAPSPVRSVRSAGSPSPRWASAQQADLARAREAEAARHFQLWKEEETRKWEAEMRNRESARMSALEQEWALREHERAKTIKIAQEEYKQLEIRMHRAITDAERRERAVARLETELQRAADQRLADLEVLHRRAREESQHKISLHKERVTSLEGELKRLRASLGTAEKRLAKVENEYAGFREKTRQSPEATLQKEIAVLQGQNADLHARLEQEKERTAAEVLEKETVKAQLVQVARELQRQMHANSARAERELDNLRLEYLAREERFVLDGDRKQLMDLRQELNELRAATLRAPMTLTEPTHVPGQAWPSPRRQGLRRPQDPPTPPSPDGAAGGRGQRRSHPVHSDEAEDLETSRKESLERLLQERDDLLRTGVYGRDHPLVVQLEEHIAMARSSTA